ncbi:MAG: alternative ribosome rescue aminoacyl-tRNA hydrolase ArfB, partial [Acidimicrobiales bacterium]
LTRIVATFRVDESEALSDALRARVVARLGPVVRATAGRYRSQSQNRAAALDQLARRLGDAIAERPTRRSTAPTRASRERRLDAKRSRARVKESRRRPDDD